MTSCRRCGNPLQLSLLGVLGCPACARAVATRQTRPDIAWADDAQRAEVARKGRQERSDERP